MDIPRTERLSREASLLTAEQMAILQSSHVMLLGLGGVGSYAAEAIARCGIGKLTIVDNDEVTVSNLNRQLPALSSTIGRKKTDVVSERLLDAAPDLTLVAVDAFYLPETPVAIPDDCSIVLDAIDTVSAKLHIAEVCKQRGIPLISCMGMGNRLDPTKIKVGDLFDTSGCPLCRTMRHELRKRGITELRCVYSTEPAISTGIRTPGSISFVPSVAGLFMASEAVHILLGETMS